MKRKAFLSLLICISLIFTISSCGDDDEYLKLTESFNDSFLKVAKSIQSNSRLISLERIESKENKQEIENMGELLKSIKENVPPKMEPHYMEMKTLYNKFLSLQKISETEGQLSYDEISDLNTAMMSIDRKREELEESHRSDEI